jgi:hypothetical protein
MNICSSTVNMHHNVFLHKRYKDHSGRYLMVKVTVKLFLYLTKYMTWRHTHSLIMHHATKI